MIFGELAGKKLMVLSGRFHCYEGRSPAEITYPINVVDALGVKTLIVTNAPGGINPQYKPATSWSSKTTSIKWGSTRSSVV